MALTATELQTNIARLYAIYASGVLSTSIDSGGVSQSISYNSSKEVWEAIQRFERLLTRATTGGSNVGVTVFSRGDDA